MKKRWYDSLWIVSLTYLILGFFNILFANHFVYNPLYFICKCAPETHTLPRFFLFQSDLSDFLVTVINPLCLVSEIE